MTQLTLPIRQTLRPHVHHDRWARPPVWAWCVVHQTRSFDQPVAHGTAATQVGKTGRRTVHLHPEVAAELAGWSRGPQLGPGGRPTSTASPDTVVGARPATVRSRLHDHLAAACEQLGQERWSPYGLRRAAVVRLYRSGVDPAVAAEAIGHSAAVALRTYRQVDEEEIAAAIERSGLGVVPAADNVVPLRRGEEGG